MRASPRLLALAWVLVGLVGCAQTAEPGGAASPHSRSTFAANLQCENCHTTEGWSIGGAGTGGRGFDHARTGFPLTGQHAEAGCIQCHTGSGAVQRECGSCHEDTHQGRMGAQCDQCHSSRDFRDVRAIELHRRTQLPLTGMHALADCTECHTRTTSFTWSAVPSACIACHENAYNGLPPFQNIHPIHNGSGGLVPLPRDCTQCHTTLGWIPATIDGAGIAPLVAGLSPGSEHDLRFPISSGPHHGLDCQSCHLDARTPRVFQCTGCHAHGLGTLATQHGGIPLLDGPGCLSCHLGGARR